MNNERASGLVDKRSFTETIYSDSILGCASPKTLEININSFPCFAFNIKNGSVKPPPCVINCSWAGDNLTRRPKDLYTVSYQGSLVNKYVMATIYVELLLKHLSISVWLRLLNESIFTFNLSLFMLNYILSEVSKRLIMSIQPMKLMLRTRGQRKNVS